ncbi:uncharacterized protein LOC125037400 [Penaeus chinensis]|uniref:uncharacterized protein LOC125037400 n=1 Tax=Penaeus chinensis TaxID=139456 RepID=UPI001FB61A9B|nr:uncharacterized protein LOC125037400 [Penaeus chinensis]
MSVASEVQSPVDKENGSLPHSEEKLCDLPSSATPEERIQYKLEKAVGFKQKGNDHFKQQQLKKAIRNYHSGLMYMKAVDQDMNPNKHFGQSRAAPKLPQETKDAVMMLTADLHNNLADTAVRKLMLQVDQELRKENKKFSDMFKNSLLVKQS